jgi:hypothetical protein
MNRVLSRAILRGLLLASFALAVLGGCGGGGQHVMPPVETTAPAGQPAGNSGLPERNILTASLPALSQLAPGSEFDFVLSAALAEELYQMSGRIGFDPAVVRPVGSEFGALLPADAVRMSRDDLPDTVPFAFTAQPGRSGIGAGRGELLRVRFRLLGSPAGGRAVWLVNEAEFLQLRDRIGRRLRFDLAREVGQ